MQSQKTLLAAALALGLGGLASPTFADDIDTARPGKISAPGFNPVVKCRRRGSQAL